MASRKTLRLEIGACAALVRPDLAATLVMTDRSREAGMITRAGTERAVGMHTCRSVTNPFVTSGTFETLRATMLAMKALTEVNEHVVGGIWCNIFWCRCYLSQ